MSLIDAGAEADDLTHILGGDKLLHLVCQSAMDLQLSQYWNSSSALLNEIAMQIGLL